MARSWFTGADGSARWRAALVALVTALVVLVPPARPAPAGIRPQAAPPAGIRPQAVPPAGIRPQAVPPAAATLQQLLDAIVSGGAPGAIGLVRNGITTVRAASGVADLRTHRPMRVDDRFRVGSVTKTFVATVVLQLVGEGRLRLNDPVERWLPRLVPDGRDITVRELLNHTSGLYNYTDDPRVLAPYLDRNDPDFVWRPRQLVAIAVSHPPLFAPGSSWSYSNTNYILLGLIVQAATRTDLGRQLYRRIFEPLRLRHTSFPVTTPHIAGRHAHGYANLHPGKPLTDTTEISASFAWAAGSIVSTVDDVGRFYRALLGGRLLRPDLLRAMKTSVPAGDSGFRYGLGIIAGDAPCATIFGHNGDYVGYFDFAISTESTDRQVVLMMNIDDEANVPPGADQAFTTALLTSICPT
jgi:D-alanyl-D-alanine carboxypeptidase